MESGPAVFSGAAFALFGSGLLLWLVARVSFRAPVAHGVSRPLAVTMTALFGTLFLVAGCWLLSTA
ncbi:hypothetical protein [Streptomyces purpurogeneiscleroticus]|uniref:hypothetical protein n=1 Tax=Streptomyces purpurogeneiscleroticus TaxID=68259 RepID=UPI001CBE614F|nr:hypothetical protein [Streptomyces purpurogeneiscleroticus]MBZ4015724.1 hypothetical protein [Streptomyces purpurogeneiscleroticus]